MFNRLRLKRFHPPILSPWMHWVILLLFCSEACLLRYSFFYAGTKADIQMFVNYYTLMRNVPFERLFAMDFTKLSTAHLYLWWPFAQWHATDPMITIKTISCGFDLACAWGLFRILRLRFAAPSFLPYYIACISLYLPTSLVNSSVWGQLDSIYTAFLLQAVFYWMRSVSASAKPHDGLCAAWLIAVAFCFKLQTTLALPALFFLFGFGAYRWWHVLLPPLCFLALQMPRFYVGLPLASAFSAYTRQIQADYQLTAETPNFYWWLQQAGWTMPWVIWLGVAAGGVLCLCFYHVGRWLRTRQKLTHAEILYMASFALICAPSILPRMHERYFYAVDWLSVALPFFYPRLWPVPFLVIAASFSCYYRYIVGWGLFPQYPHWSVPSAAIAMLAAVAWMALGVTRFLLDSRRHSL